MRISLLVLALAATTSFALPLTHDERSDSSVQPIALLRARRLGKFDSFGKGGSGGSKVSIKETLCLQPVRAQAHQPFTRASLAGLGAPLRRHVDAAHRYAARRWRRGW